MAERGSDMKAVEAAGQLLFLVTRGLALWILIPLAFVSWLLVHSWAQRASVRQAACWYDSNFTLVLRLALLRRQIAKSGGVRFIRASEMRGLPARKLRWLGGLADFSTTS